MLVCVFLCMFAHETAGAGAHPAFPAPSFCPGGWQSTQSSGASCRGVVNSCLESTCLKASLRANGRECAPDDRLRDAIHLFLFVATMDCFVASAPRNDASACVAIPQRSSGSPKARTGGGGGG